MIYAIDADKNHRIVSKGSGFHALVTSYLDIGEAVVEADADGWIAWHGGECPLPINAAHKIKMRDGEISKLDDEADSWCWEHHGGEGDIIAYRPILDVKPEPPAWDGEGLPPVGCECECSLDFSQPKKNANWAKVEVLYVDQSTVVGKIIEGPDWSKFSNGFEANLYKFRPIRSEEDEAVDDMLAVNEYARDLEDFCHSLYRAGYRKTGVE